jgi:CTP-dependent riboflavin kinase
MTKYEDQVKKVLGGGVLGVSDVSYSLGTSYHNTRRVLEKMVEEGSLHRERRSSGQVFYSIAAKPGFWQKIKEALVG